MKSSDAVPGASLSTRADRKNTSAIWPTNRPMKSTELPTRACIRAGEPAIDEATNRGIRRPAHIHPYTARRNAVARSAAAVLLENGVAGSPSKRSIVSSSATGLRRVRPDRFLVHLGAPAGTGGEQEVTLLDLRLHGDEVILPRHHVRIDLHDTQIRDDRAPV